MGEHLRNESEMAEGGRVRVPKTLQVLALSLGNGVAAVTGLVTAMVLSRVLSKGDFATYRQTFLVYELIAPLLLLGLPQALYYFLPTDNQHQRARVAACLLLTSVASAGFAAIVGGGGATAIARAFDNPDLEVTLHYLVVYPFFALPLALISPVLVVRERVRTLSVFNVVAQTFVSGAAISAALIWVGHAAPVIGRIGMTGLVAVASVALMSASMPKGPWAPRAMAIREVLRYSFPLGLSALVGTVIIRLDKAVVSAMTTPEEFAVYSNGAMEIPLIGVVTGSITSVVLAELRSSVAERRTGDAVRLFRLTSEKSSFLLLPVMAFLLVAADPFIRTVFSDKYARSAEPFRIYLMLLPARTVVFGAFMVALGETRAILFRTVVSLALNAALSILLVKLMGSVGAAVATVAVILFWATPFNLFVISRATKIAWYRLLPFRHLLRTTTFLLLPSAATLVVQSVVADKAPWLRLLVQTTVFWPPVIWWWRRQFGSLREIFGGRTPD
ncbi:MAG: oligosaccharide flippase family protein [Myxococcales bacterium]|jgi:O-antigen/teichoic acid export membrane protein